MSLEEFQATKKYEVKDKYWCEQFSPENETQAVYEYSEGCYISIEKDGNFSLLIGNNEWYQTDLAQLENILYTEWYLREVA